MSGTHFIYRALQTVLLPSLIWKFRQIVTSPWPVWLWSRAVFGSVLHLPAAESQSFCSCKGKNSIGLFRLLVTECRGKWFVKLLDISKGSVKSNLSQIVRYSELQTVGRVPYETCVVLFFIPITPSGLRYFSLCFGDLSEVSTAWREEPKSWA